MSAIDLPTPDELQRRASELFSQWRVGDTAVDVAWNTRLSTTVGRAFVRRGRIELNPHLLAKAPAQLETVLTHEAAHVAAFRLFGANIPTHGRHWRSLMRLVGQEPDVTHRILVKRLRRRRSYLYLRVCGACGERAVSAKVSYGRCRGCSRRDEYLVVRATASAAGRRALARMSLPEVRAHFA